MNTGVLLLFFSQFFAAATAAGQTDMLTILHVNDTHGNLANIGPRNASLVGSLGGLARAASLIGGERLTDPELKWDGWWMACCIRGRTGFPGTPVHTQAASASMP
jgi:hypothetical protein